MSVVVAYKYAPNPQDARVGEDGIVDWSRAKAAMSEYDPVAIELGRILADEMSSELVGISVGTSAVGASMAKKNAMSKGFDRGLIVSDDITSQWNQSKVASALAELARRADANIVLTGDSSIDNGMRITSALIAGFLGWPCFQDVTAVHQIDGGFAITQEIPGGSRTLEVTGPVVLAATSDAVLPSAPSMKEILAAAKKPVEVLSASEVSPVDAGLDTVGREKPVAKERKRIIFTGEDAVNKLVNALRADGVL